MAEAVAALQKAASADSASRQAGDLRAVLEATMLYLVAAEALAAAAESASAEARPVLLAKQQAVAKRVRTLTKKLGADGLDLPVIDDADADLATEVALSQLDRALAPPTSGGRRGAASPPPTAGATAAVDAAPAPESAVFDVGEDHVVTAYLCDSWGLVGSTLQVNNSAWPDWSGDAGFTT